VADYEKHEVEHGGEVVGLQAQRSLPFPEEVACYETKNQTAQVSLPRDVRD